MFISGPGVITGVSVSMITAIVLNRTSHFLEITGTTLPSAIRNNAYSAWKWRNFLISFIHSTISGLTTIFCMVSQPSLRTDMIGASSQTAYLLASFSLGYFLYDLVEMILNLKYKGSGELVFHHLFVMSCLTISVLQQKYLGFAVLGVGGVEISNIFLHFRQLLNIAKVSKQCIVYRVNRWLNIVCFLFRLFLLVYLTRCMLDHRQYVPVSVFLVAAVCVVVISIMTSVLFYRLIQSDFGKPTSCTQAVLNDHSINDTVTNGTSSSLVNGSSHTTKNKFN